MSNVCVSIIVTEQSQVLENKLHQAEVLFGSPEEAAVYRDSLDEWLDAMPIPGQKIQSVYLDHASELAAKLPEIIMARDPEVFGPYFHDTEGDSAMINRRPYDWANMEMVG